MIHIHIYFIFCSSNEWEDCESAEWVDGWVHVSFPIGQCIGLELSQLEEDESAITPDYDHISDLVQLGSFNILCNLLTSNNVVCFIYDWINMLSLHFLYGTYT